MRGLTVAHSSRILDSDLARISEKCNLFVTCNPCSHEPTSFVRITFIRMESNRFVCMRFLFSTSRRRRRRRRRRGKAESVELVISYRQIRDTYFIRVSFIVIDRGSTDFFLCYLSIFRTSNNNNSEVRGSNRCDQRMITFGIFCLARLARFQAARKTGF